MGLRYGELQRRERFSSGESDAAAWNCGDGGTHVTAFAVNRDGEVASLAGPNQEWQDVGVGEVEVR